jgi:diguanylate cyclase (GGDEF)-like protein
MDSKSQRPPALLPPLASERATAPPSNVLVTSLSQYVTPRSRLAAAEVGRNQGLKSGQVHTVVEGADGRLWMSGPCGLSCYDGSRIVCFDQSHGLTSQGLRGLGTDADGRIWVGFDGGLDVVETDGTIRAVSAQPDWRFGPAKQIAFADDGAIYIATSRGLIRGSHPQARECHFAPAEHAELGNDVIVDLAVDYAGRMAVVGARCGVWVFRGGSGSGGGNGNDNSTKGGIWTEISRVLYAKVGTILCVAMGDMGQLFIGGSEGLVCATIESDLLNTPCELIYEGVVNAICVSRSDVWMASSKHVKRLRSHSDAGSQETSWTIDAEFDAAASVNDLRCDSVGNIWCATDAAGVAKITVMRDAIVQPDLGETGQIFSVRPGREGTLLIGAEHAVFRAKPGVSDEFKRVKHVADARVWDVLEQLDGTLWLATHTQGLLRVESGGQTTRVGEHHPVLNAAGRTLAWFDGHLWVGTLRGLAVVTGTETGQEIEEICEADGASLGYVYTLLIDRQNLWIGTLGNGLWHYTKETGLKRIVGEGLSNTGNSYSVAKNERGELVVLQDNRIVNVSQDAPPKLIATCDEPVSGWTAQFISADVLAVGTSDGLVEFNIRDGKRGRQIRCGGIGFAGWEFTSSRALVIDYRNRLWCALNSGLTIVELNGIDVGIGVPQVNLLDARWERATPKQNGAHYVIPVGNWRATFRCFSAWLVDETDVTYRHKLIGFEESWSPLKREAEFSFNALPHGTYLLEVQAHSPLAGFGAVRQVASIEVTAPWWSAAGLDRAVDAVASVKSLFSNRARNERLLTVNQELAQAVQARTREVANANLALHEVNLKLADLLRTDSLTEIPNRRSFDETMTREWKRAVRDDMPLSILMVDIDYFKPYNDRYGHQRGDACLRLVAQCLARSVREGIDTCARYGGEEFVLVLPNTPLQNARKMSERLCAVVAAMRIEHADSPQTGVITISVGVAALEPHARESVAELIAAADASLYAAKRRGRNQVGPPVTHEGIV